MWMDELKPSNKLVGAVMVQTGFHHYEADRPPVLSADAPSLAPAVGFQDRVAKAAQNQGPQLNPAIGPARRTFEFPDLTA